MAYFTQNPKNAIALEGSPVEPLHLLADQVGYCCRSPGVGFSICAGVKAALKRFPLRVGEEGRMAAIEQNRPGITGPVEAVVERVLDEMLGLGSLDPLLRDESIEDIYVLSPHKMIVVRADRQRERVPVNFGGQEKHPANQPELA